MMNLTDEGGKKNLFFLRLFINIIKSITKVEYLKTAIMNNIVYLLYYIVLISYAFT